MLNFIRNASVEVVIIHDSEIKPCVRIIVDDRYVHTFSPSSKESRMAGNTEKQVLESYFNGGSYFFYGDTLVDYRSSQYTGFIHDENAILELSNRIGISQQKEANIFGSGAGQLFNQSRTRKTNGVFVGGEWDKFDLSVKSLGIGGEFENKLIYKWSPFTSNITTSLEVERLICTNGMMGSSPFVTFEVPLINDWERNLSVISAQLKPRINDMLTMRFDSMTKDRATVYDVVRAHELLSGRQTDNMTPQDMNSLLSLVRLTDVGEHLHGFYQGNVFNDKNMSKNTPAHLTQFDVFNILTECSSHYGNDEDNNHAMQRDINRIVFDEFGRKKNIMPTQPVISDSDHRRAFFGKD